MRQLLAILLIGSASIAQATDVECNLDQQPDAITALFSQKTHIYSVLWWTDPQSTVINARSFVINGHDSVPVFSSELEARAQLEGSGYEKELVGIDPGLMAAILQGKEYAVLNPGGKQPIQFKTCILTPFVKVPGAQPENQADVHTSAALRRVRGLCSALGDKMNQLYSPVHLSLSLQRGLWGAVHPDLPAFFGPAEPRT